MTEIKNGTAKQNKIWNAPYDVGDEVFYYSPFQEAILKTRIMEVKGCKDETNEIKWRFVVRFTKPNGLTDDNDTTERHVSFDKDVLARRFKIGEFCS